MWCLYENTKSSFSHTDFHKKKEKRKRKESGKEEEKKKEKIALSGNKVCSEDQRIYTHTKMRISHVHPYPFFLSSPFFNNSCV